MVIEVDSRYYRPTEVENLLGDPSHAEEKLGWERKISFEELVKEMVEHDMREAKRELHLKEGGFEVRTDSE